MGQWLAQRIGKEYAERQIPFHFMLTRAKGNKWDGVPSLFFFFFFLIQIRVLFFLYNTYLLTT